MNKWCKVHVYVNKSQQPILQIKTHLKVNIKGLPLLNTSILWYYSQKFNTHGYITHQLEKILYNYIYINLGFKLVVCLRPKMCP